LTCVLIQPDGKILLGGYFIEYYVDGEGFDYYYQRSLLIRLNPNGTADPTFAYASGNLDTWIESVALQADGKVIINGSGLARLNANGSLDGSFNSGGRDDSVVALHPDGKVLIGGYFGIARLNANGSLDGSFNPKLAPAPGSGYLSSIAVQPDGKMLIAGYFTAVNGTNRNNIARLNANGSLDSSFNPGTGADAQVSSIALQPDGKVLIGGDFTFVNGAVRPRVARLYGDSAPSLKIARSNALVIVSWPSPSTGFVVQQNTDLKTTNWTTSSETVTDNDTIKFIIVNPSTGNRFYRLFKP
jgi:uncharacterized delta-60 repeat protein